MPSPRKSASKVKTVRRTLADGTVKEYSYKRGRPKPKSPYDTGTVGALMLAFERSPEWRALAEQTRRTYRVYLRDLGKLKVFPVAEVTKRVLMSIRDGIADARGNGAGTGFTRTASAVFAWAIEREWITHNPAIGIKPLPAGQIEAWTEEEAQLAMRELPEPLRRAVVLAYHTGQRRTDLVRLTWAAYDGASIRLRQQKTGVALVLPVHPELKAELDMWARNRSATTILTAPRGKPWSPQDLSHALPPALERIGFGRRLTIHGLRKLTASRLAEAGCSAHEIAAITGHKSLSMVQFYTRAADQERMASAAVFRLPSGKRGKTETDPAQPIEIKRTK